MKKRALVISIPLILTCIALVSLTLHHGKTATPEEVARSEPPDAPTHQQLVDRRIAMIKEMAKSGPNYKCLMPLNFYGKVVDQDNNPVPKAKVKFHYVPDPNGYKWYESESAENGTFSYGGKTGQFLFVKVGAPKGYGELESTCSADYNYAVPGEFNFHVPDPNQPVLFRVWKFINPEPMNNWNLKCKVAANDGRIYGFDLKNGVIGGNDLGICIMSRDFVKSPDQWRGLKVVAGPGCGVLESKGEPMMFAPESGYSNEIRHTFNGNPGEYVDNEGKTIKVDPFVFKFYFRHSDGTFAAIVANVSPAMTYHSPARKDKISEGVVHLLVKKNPSGSRSLEYIENLSIQDGKSEY